MFHSRTLHHGLLVSWLFILAVPAHATIQYSFCSNGCTNTNTGMTYSTFQALAAPFANSFSSPITFLAADLNGSGIYTDSTTGTVFTGYNASQVQEPLIIGSGASLAQTGNSVAGKDRSIGITLPPNTYAVGMFLSSTANFANPFAVTSLAHFNLTNANYDVVISNSGDSQFFGLISNTPLTTLFLGDLLSFQSPIRILSLETGASVTTTPEASTFGLIGVGLIAIRLLRRRGIARNGPLRDGVPAQDS